MSVKSKATEFKNNHPTTAKIVKTIVAAGAVTVACVTAVEAIEYINDKGLMIEISSFETREARFKMDGDARELFNAALGIEAKGLDASKTWCRYNTIAESYIGKHE